MPSRPYTGTSPVSSIGAGGALSDLNARQVLDNVSTASQPSRLKITDLRVANVRDHWIIRLDTNQGISGYGEVRDAASPTYALFLKSRLLGQNPCNIDHIFRSIKQFGGHGRQAGGVAAIEMACCDLAGKAWGVPCWQMLGGKFRDRVRVYADTPSMDDPVAMGAKLKERMARGYTFLKMDVSINLLDGIEGALSWPGGGRVIPDAESGRDDWARTPHPFTGTRITDKGLGILADYVGTVRDITGWEVPIATDHYGHFGIEDGIRLARALDPFNLAWYEDMVPWFYTGQHLRLRDACTTPVATGEDIYLKEGFADLFAANAIAVCHPDLATAGGLLETKKIGDLAMDHGIAMALHMAGSPVALYASVHCAAATQNFLVMEHHNVDDDWYDRLVMGVPKPLMDADGFISVPDGPGLGIDLDGDYIRAMFRDPEKEWFPPTDDWNDERSWDRLWS